LPTRGTIKEQKVVVFSHGSWATGFHKYSVDWSEDGIKCFVDDVEILNVDPGTGGFWEFGEFDTLAPGSDNPWRLSENKMAPFDQEVMIICHFVHGVLFYLFYNFPAGIFILILKGYLNMCQKIYFSNLRIEHRRRERNNYNQI